MRCSSRRFLISLVTILMFYAESALATNSEAARESVAAAFENYANAWEKKNFARVWNLMSPNIKKGDSDSAKAFEDYVKKNDFYASDFHVLDISVNGDSAKIKAKVTYSDLSGRKLVEEIENIVFVRIEGAWYFDSYTTQGYD